MTYDIILTEKNSIEWLETSLQALSKVDYNTKDITIIIIDNNSSNSNLITNLNVLKRDYHDIFKEIKLLFCSKEKSIEEIYKIGFLAGVSSYVCFLEYGSEITKFFLKEIEHSFKFGDKSHILGEFRRLPHNNFSIYNPNTLDIEWLKSYSFVVKRVELEELFGKKAPSFNNIDLNLKIRLNGYKVQYLPKVVLYLHKSILNDLEDINYIVGKLHLCFLYGRFQNFIREYILSFRAFFHMRNPYRLKLFKELLLVNVFLCLKWRIVNRPKIGLLQSVLAFDRQIRKINAYNEAEIEKSFPKVSVIVRTCGRPNVLRETLRSLKNQTYNNIEVVVFEDGENISEQMIKNEFSDLNINYYYSGVNVGRCVAGNNAMAAATGKYLNFLDDDDIFLPDHIEVLVNKLENSNCRIAYSLALQTPICVKSTNPYIHFEKSYELIYNQPFNRLLLFLTNYIPIQCVMFAKDVFLEEGGMDEKFEALEDWDLWMRYVCKNDFLFVNKITSVYRVPYAKAVNNKRNELHKRMVQFVRQKQDLYFLQVKANDCAADMQNIIDFFIFKYFLRRTFILSIRAIFKKVKEKLLN